MLEEVGNDSYQIVCCHVTKAGRGRKRFKVL